jgi:hypothetical protein
MLTPPPKITETAMIYSFAEIAQELRLQRGALSAVRPDSSLGCLGLDHLWRSELLTSALKSRLEWRT